MGSPLARGGCVTRLSSLEGYGRSRRRERLKRPGARPPEVESSTRTPANSLQVSSAGIFCVAGMPAFYARLAVGYPIRLGRCRSLFLERSAFSSRRSTRRRWRGSLPRQASRRKLESVAGATAAGDERRFARSAGDRPRLRRGTFRARGRTRPCSPRNVKTPVDDRGARLRATRTRRAPRSREVAVDARSG